MTEPRSLYRGCVGPDVEAWQRSIGASVDGDFGEKTEELTKAFQRRENVTPDGVVGPLTRAALERAKTLRPPAPILPPLPPPPEPISPKPVAFLPARYFDRSRYGSAITVVVIHTAETGEGPKSARGTAGWFVSEMRGKDGKIHKASAHFCVDAAEIIQCVRESEMAFGAPYANRNGLHVEHAGRAKQSAAEWADAYSSAMLERSAILVADLCRRNGIPIKRLSSDELKAGSRGICGHDTVSKAFPVKDAHWDPGPSFPWAKYIELVMRADGMGDRPHVA